MLESYIFLKSSRLGKFTDACFAQIRTFSKMLSNKNQKWFKSNENIHKKEGGSYYVVSANKASSVTLQSPGNESQRKYTANFKVGACL